MLPRPSRQFNPCSKEGPSAQLLPRGRSFDAIHSAILSREHRDIHNRKNLKKSRCSLRIFLIVTIDENALPHALGRTDPLWNRGRFLFSKHYILRVSKPLIIGIAGGSGSGKSTVARKVAEALKQLSVAFIDMDAYYRNFTNIPLEERRRVNWDHPDAFDFDLLTEHLSELAERRTIDKPVYDFVTHLRSGDTVRVEPSDVIVIDGILLFVDQRVRDLCDVKVFVDADADIRLIRRLRRDMRARGRPLNEIIDQYLSTVQPMHLQFVEPSKRYADIIVPRGGHNEIAIEMIVAKISKRLAVAMA